VAFVAFFLTVPMISIQGRAELNLWSRWGSLQGQQGGKGRTPTPPQFVTLAITLTVWKDPSAPVMQHPFWAVDVSYFLLKDKSDLSK